MTSKWGRKISVFKNLSDSISVRYVDAHHSLGMKPLWETLGCNMFAFLLLLIFPCYQYFRWNLRWSCFFFEPASQLSFIMTPTLKLHFLWLSWFWSELSELSSQEWQTTPHSFICLSLNGIWFRYVEGRSAIGTGRLRYCPGPLWPWSCPPSPAVLILLYEMRCPLKFFHSLSWCRSIFCLLISTSPFSAQLSSRVDMKMKSAYITEGQ